MGRAQFSRRCLENWSSVRVEQIKAAHVGEVAGGKPFAKLVCQPLCQGLDDLCSISGPVFATLFFFDDAPANFKVGVDLNQVHATSHSSAGPDDQFANVAEKCGREFHSSPRMVSSTAALSASNTAISSMMSSALRCATASPPFGFFTERSKVAGSMALASTLQDLGESAEVVCNVTNSARSASLSGRGV